jgi:hypothetical protein
LQKAFGNASASATWSFTAASLGHAIDMEALSCGPDACRSSMYIGDEFGYIYKLNLGQSGAAAIAAEWDLRDALGAVELDKGIEALACARCVPRVWHARAVEALVAWWS